jgi:hypothetical protein
MNAFAGMLAGNQIDEDDLKAQVLQMQLRPAAH